MSFWKFILLLLAIAIIYSYPIIVGTIVGGIVLAFIIYYNISNYLDKKSEKIFEEEQRRLKEEYEKICQEKEQKRKEEEELYARKYAEAEKEYKECHEKLENVAGDLKWELQKIEEKIQDFLEDREYLPNCPRCEQDRSFYLLDLIKQDRKLWLECTSCDKKFYYPLDSIEKGQELLTLFNLHKEKYFTMREELLKIEEIKEKIGQEYNIHITILPAKYEEYLDLDYHEDLSPTASGVLSVEKRI